MIPSANENKADDAAVREFVTALDAAQSDPDAFGALLHEDVRVTNVAGRQVAGRAALLTAMRQALDGSLALVTTRTEILDIVFPGADVALVTARKHITDRRPDGDAPAAGALQVTAVRTDSGWQAAALQTTPQRAA